MPGRDNSPYIRRAHGPGAVLAGRGAGLVRVSVVGKIGETSIPKGSDQPRPSTIEACGFAPIQRVVENDCRIRDTADMEYSLEQMARSLVESGDYRVTSRLEPQAEYHPPNS